MSREGMKEVVKRMLSDEDFRLTLLEDPEKVIRAEGFDVTEEELEAFKTIEEEDLVNLSLEELEGRLSKSEHTLIGSFSEDAAAY